MPRRGESQVEIALLALLLAEFFPEVDATSELIGEWAGCNPVIVRRIYGKLKRAGLLETGPGRRSLELARDARSISLLEIVEAITPLDRAGVFGVEAPLSGTCSIKSELFGTLTTELDQAVAAMRQRLASTTLHDYAMRLLDRCNVPAAQKLNEIFSNVEEAERRHPAARLSKKLRRW